MAASLLVRVRRAVPFSAVLERTSAMLSQTMNPRARAEVGL